MGFHIQFQEVGAQSLVRGVLKGEKGVVLKFDTAQFEPEQVSREGE